MVPRLPHRLTNGALYALVALGYTLVYGILELINFAHGDVFMLGAMMAAVLIGEFGLTELVLQLRCCRRSWSPLPWRCSGAASSTSPWSASPTSRSATRRASP